MPELKAFARPVRIIFGAEDPYLDPGVARYLYEALPTSDLSLLPQKGHWPQLDGAPEVAQLLLSIPEV
jgi:haloalkane dehalogenase